jgi:hypothetical protein
LGLARVLVQAQRALAATHHVALLDVGALGQQQLDDRQVACGGGGGGGMG